MKLKVDCEPRKVTCHHGKKTFVLEYINDFPFDFFEINNDCIKKTGIAPQGHIIIDTKNKQRISIYLKVFGDNNGPYSLEVDKFQVDEKGRVIGSSICRLKGQWEKEFETEKNVMEIEI